MVAKRRGVACNVSVKGEEIAKVKVKYLGAMFNEGESYKDEVTLSRLGLACSTTGALRKEVVDCKEFSKTTKLRMYNAM